MSKIIIAKVKSANNEDTEDTQFHLTCGGRSVQVRTFLDRSPFFVARFEFRRRAYWRSTKTDVPAAAAKKAREIWRDILEGNSDTGKFKNNYATVGEVLDRYDSGTAVRTRTRRGNISCLLRILRAAKGDLGNPRSVRIDEITPDMFVKFVAKSRKAAEARIGQDPWAGKRVAVSVNSTLRCARSIFAKAAMPLYAGLKLTGGNPLDGCQLLPESRDIGYQPIDRAVIDTVEESARGLLDSDRDLWLAYMLVSRCGLRNIEVLACRGSWLERREKVIDGLVFYSWVLGIIERSDFSPKGKSRWVAVPEFLADGMRLVPAHEHVVAAGRNESHRYDMVYRRLSDWLKKMLPTGRRSRKTVYELRKHNGSIIATRDGLLAAQEHLGHADHTTTSNHYATLLRPIAPVVDL